MQGIDSVRPAGQGVRCFVNVGECQGIQVPSVKPVLTATATRESRQGTAFERPCPVVEHRPVPWWKRPLDLFLILVLLPALGLVFLLVAMLIKVVSPGPVLFVQERVGHGGKRFRLLKFRTMRTDNNAGVHQQHLTELMKSDRPMKKLDMVGDTRIIPFGKALRCSGLDELPQVINVLRGEMSMVGPRPCTVYEYAIYQPWHRERLSALPGLTGLWQVSGKNRTTFDQMVRLDIDYARRPSLMRDLMIILKTVPALVVQMCDQMAARRKPPGRSATRSPSSSQPECA